MSADYATWRPAAQIVLAVLFLVGGCSGSTAGGVKVVRWTVLAKQLRNDFRRILHPHEIVTLRLNGMSGREDVVPLVASFVMVYGMLVVVTAFAGSLAGLGLTEAFTAALSMVGNVGPAFGSMGPTANYGALPDALKWFYSFAMLAGRLEIYTMLVLIIRAAEMARQSAVSGCERLQRSRRQSAT
jgi:trk system potassium uptake protein TrkH